MPEESIEKVKRPPLGVWFYADMKNPSKSSREMILRYSTNGQPSNNKPLWCQYAAILALSGARRIEPFLKPITVSYIEKRGAVYYRIVKVNAKHFTGQKEKATRDEKGKIIKLPPAERFKQAHREIMTQIWKPIDSENKINQEEKSLFDYLLEGRSQRTFDFSPLLGYRNGETLGKFTNPDYNGPDQEMKDILNNISKSFSRIFRADIKGPPDAQGVEQIRLNAPMRCHSLRHIRCYDLLINKGFSDFGTARQMGWDSREMIDYYTMIKRSMDEDALIREWEKI